jgi:hypothetical protein
LSFAWSHTVHLGFILALIAAIGREHALKGTMVVAFTTGFLFIYGLAADVLFRHRTLIRAGGWFSRTEHANILIHLCLEASGSMKPLIRILGFPSRSRWRGFVYDVSTGLLREIKNS